MIWLVCTCREPSTCAREVGMRLLVAVQLLAAVSAWRLDLSLRSMEQPPLDLCEGGATAANLGANALRAVPPCCPSFRTLQVHRNLIRELPEDWLLQCPQLEEVSVSGNSLRRLPARLLSSNWSLRRLQASRILLDSVPPQLLSNATELTELDLSHNLLTALPPAFLETNTQLEELYLQGNSLESIPEQVLWTCGRLRQLWLSGNRLPRLPEALLASASRLRILRLDHNQLTVVDDGAFRNNRQLVLVDLSSNYLTLLPTGLFANAESLRYLLLRDNRLHVVPASGSLPERPISLDLRDNHLHTVEDFGVFGSSRVWLDGNQWRCGCRLAPVIREAASSRQFLWFRQHPLCHLGERDRRSFSYVNLTECHISGVYSDRRVATSSTVPSPASTYFDKSASDVVAITTTLGAAVWGPGNNTSLTPTYTSDIETTTSEIGTILSIAHEFDPSIQNSRLVTYNTTTDADNYNSATTDITVSSPIAATSDVNTSQNGSPLTDVNGSDNFETNNPTDDSNESSLYDDIVSH